MFSSLQAAKDWSSQACSCSWLLLKHGALYAVGLGTGLLYGVFAGVVYAGLGAYLVSIP